MPAVESVGVFCKVSIQILGFNSMMGSPKPGLGMGDEFVDPGEPAVEEKKILSRLAVDLDILELPIRLLLPIGIHARPLFEGLIDEGLNSFPGFWRHCDFGKSGSDFFLSSFIHPVFGFNGDQDRLLISALPSSKAGPNQAPRGPSGGSVHPGFLKPLGSYAVSSRWYHNF